MMIIFANKMLPTAAGANFHYILPSVMRSSVHNIQTKDIRTQLLGMYNLCIKNAA